MVRRLSVVSLAMTSLLVGLAAVEWLLAIGLRHSRSLDGHLLGAVRQVHLAAEWPLVQLTSACARWDPELTYTLRPPGCTVVDREFVARYTVNSLGLRDTEASLVAPTIIALGDSYAMGWGVPDADPFPKVLERHLRVRVLNAGIASYGTAREVSLLSRLDRSAMRALVLQFCWNDVGENRAWVAGGKLRVTPRAGYEREVAAQARALRYWPGKYLFTLARVTFERIVRGSRVADAHADGPGEVAQAVDDLVTLLERHGGLFATRPAVVVVPMCARETEVAAALLARARAAPDESVARLVSVVDPAPSIETRHLYPLDGHLNVAGHRLVARLVARELVRRHVVDRRAHPRPPAAGDGP